MRAALLPAAGFARCAARRGWGAATLRWPRPAIPRRFSTAAAASTGITSTTAGLEHLHESAQQGPQPETLFRPDAASLAGYVVAAGKGSEGEEGGKPPGDLPGFGELPHPDYGSERPQEQTGPEPENPLPEGLPSNRPREGEEAPEAPQPLEVPLPRRSEPDLPSQFPPDVVPMPSPPEAPQPGPPFELPGQPAPPEFTPGAPSEMPDRGGSEISFP